MLTTTLDAPNLAKVLPGPVWAEVLDWVRQNAHSADLGRHEIRGDAVFVSVQSYSTKHREECRFESHRQYVDLQYVIEGTEGIDYCPAASLTPDGEFQPEKDVQLYLPPKDVFCTLPISGNHFCVLFPEDAHRPQVAVAAPREIRKLVVKVEVGLENSELRSKNR